MSEKQLVNMDLLKNDLKTSQTVSKPVACCGKMSVDTQAICLCAQMLVDEPGKGSFCYCPRTEGSYVIKKQFGCTNTVMLSASRAVLGSSCYLSYC